MNLQEVHSGMMNYTAETFDEMHSVIEYKPVTDIEIKDEFSSTSSEVLNSVIDELGRAVDEKQGL